MSIQCIIIPLFSPSPSRVEFGFNFLFSSSFRSWTPDRTLSQARKYIEESLGSKYAEGVILDLQQTWEESDNRTPLICFLSMGSDPTNSIEQLAKRMKLGKCIPNFTPLFSCLTRFFILSIHGLPFFLHFSGNLKSRVCLLCWYATRLREKLNKAVYVTSMEKE